MLCCIGGVCIPLDALLPFLGALFYMYLWTPMLKLFGFETEDDKKKKKALAAKSSTSTTASSSSSCCSAKTDSCCDSKAPSSSSSLACTQECNGEYLEDDDQFQPSINRTDRTAIVVRFTASWCKPCKRIEPTFLKLAEKYKGKLGFLTIDVDKSADIYDAAGNALGIPFFQVYKRGEVVGLLNGDYSEDLESLVDEHAL